MKFYVQSVVSKKSGNFYTALFCDLGYRVAIVSLDKVFISELTSLPLSDISQNKITTAVEFKPLQRV